MERLLEHGVRNVLHDVARLALRGVEAEGLGEVVAVAVRDHGRVHRRTGREGAVGIGEREKGQLTACGQLLYPKSLSARLHLPQQYPRIETVLYFFFRSSANLTTSGRRSSSLALRVRYYWQNVSCSRAGEERVQRVLVSILLRREGLALEHVRHVDLVRVHEKEVRREEVRTLSSAKRVPKK